MTYKMIFDFGDFSNDGHGRKETVHLSCNYSADRIGQAYKQSIKDTGVCFHNEVAKDYEDDVYPVERFQELGCPEEILRGNNREEFPEWGVFDIDHMLELFIWFCSLSLADLEVKQENPPNLRESCAQGNFGYGMFI